MTQTERRLFLIASLLSERPDGDTFEIPKDSEGQCRLLRGLMNVRPARPNPKSFL